MDVIGAAVSTGQTQDTLIITICEQTRSSLHVPKVLGLEVCLPVAATRVTLRVIQNRVSISQSRNEIHGRAQHAFVFLFERQLSLIINPGL